jgi:KDO2-lipid IV(A) lauroyltransferase
LNWSPGQKRKNDALFIAASAGIRLGLSLPRSWLGPAGDLLGLAAYALLGRARRAATANLALVHPELDGEAHRALARGTFRSLGRNLIDTLALLDPNEDPARSLHVSASSERVLSDALARGRGVIYATCHLGPWERMAALLAQRGYPITTVARESYDPRFHALVYEPLRGRRNVQVIYRAAPSAPVAIVRALRRGRVLGLLLDMPGRIATQVVTWLGLPSRMPVGAARLALRLRSPVVVGTPAPHRAGLEIRITSLETEDLAPRARRGGALPAHGRRAQQSGSSSPSDPLAGMHPTSSPSSAPASRRRRIRRATAQRLRDGTTPQPCRRARRATP